jgi:hypothetical protein
MLAPELADTFATNGTHGFPCDAACSNARKALGRAARQGGHLRQADRRWAIRAHGIGAHSIHAAWQSRAFLRGRALPRTGQFRPYVEKDDEA